MLALVMVVMGSQSLRWFNRGGTQESKLKVSAHMWPASTALEGEAPGKTDKLNAKDSQNSTQGKTEAESPGDKISTEKDFHRLLVTANLTSTITIAKTTQVLRAEDPVRIAGYFTKILKEIGQDDSDKRERLVFIANELQSDELLPFWEDLLNRNPPRYENETKYLGYGEPTEELLSIQLELLNAVRNLGLVGLRNPSATKFLSELILHPSSRLHDDFIRERAYISLKEASLPLSIRVLKSLKSDDSLRQRLLRP